MRKNHEKTFRASDGQVLFYRYWPAETERPRGAILLFHRGHEHSGRMAHLVDELDLPEFAFFAWDARGHGRSQAAGAGGQGGQGSGGQEATAIESVHEDYSRTGR